MLLLIDNYDSFTYNLYHQIAAFGVEVKVVRNDAHTVDELMSWQPQAVILSPGPGTPDDAGVCLGMIEACAELGAAFHPTAAKGQGGWRHGANDGDDVGLRRRHG